jgi:hypothetical protein
MPFIKKRILDRRNRKSYIAKTLKFGFGRYPQSLQEEAAGDFFWGVTTSGVSASGHHRWSDRAGWKREVYGKAKSKKVHETAKRI